MEISFGTSVFRIKGPAPPIDWPVVAQILGSNLVALAVACREHWSIVMLIVPFWFQSVAIGFFTWIRLLQLNRFSTAGIDIDGEPVEESAATRERIADFFLLHYGGFHLGYAVFGICMARDGKFPGMLAFGPHDVLAAMALIALFVFAQYSEFKRTSAGDATRKPNIGAIDCLPYVRIVPMHLILVGGALFANGTRALVIFGALKTAADLIMYLIGRRIDAGTD